MTIVRDSGKTYSLVHGSRIISRLLKGLPTPFGWLYRFDRQKPPRAKPLLLWVASVSLVSVPMIGAMVFYLMDREGKPGSYVERAQQSIFVKRTIRASEYLRLVCFSVTFFAAIYQHRSVAQVIAQSKKHVNLREQSNVARLTCRVFLLKSLAKSAAYSPFFYPEENLGLGLARRLILHYVIMVLQLSLSAPIMFTCYLGASLGKHVENFSKLYVDSLFDQFMKAVGMEEEHEQDSERSSGSQSDSELESDSSVAGKRSKSCCNIIWNQLCGLLGLFERIISWLDRRFKRLCYVLLLRQYPELPEMKMSKLSSKTNIKISQSKRLANDHLIRVRLKRTQIMLSELRDAVSDINKMSSLVIIIQIIYDIVMILAMTNSLINMKDYGENLYLVFSVMLSILSFALTVFYVCICLDETTSQLKLMINKIFDFIIMNHRVQTYPDGHQSSEQHPFASSLSLATIDSVSKIQDSLAGGSHTTAGQSISITNPRNLPEHEMLSETWSQFQYTRKLANTIDFTMGGVLPVNRRLVLSIMGHMLSILFVSIEIMSIVDTSNSSTKMAAAHHVTNSTANHNHR